MSGQFVADSRAFDFFCLPEVGAPKRTGGRGIIGLVGLKPLSELGFIELWVWFYLKSY
jgi:hypothetical protein